MPRPKKCRRIEGSPTVTYFKPQGIPLRDLTEVYLTMDGYEALRLADYEGLTTGEGASRMGVSRHTFGRMLGDARLAVAKALIEGLALRIENENDPKQAIRAEQTAPPKREVFMTRIAVTSDGPNLTDQMDPRFGRAGGFVVVDLETMSSTYVDNGSSQAMAHGAGIQAAENIVNAGAGVLLTGYVGPKAFAALDGAGVKIGQNLENMTVAEAIELYKAGKVPFADAPNK